MADSKPLLVWLVEVLDKNNLPATDVLRIKSLMDDLLFTVNRAAELTATPISHELSVMLKELQHGSNYIRGTVPLAGVGDAISAGPRAVVPSQMDQCFANQKPMYVENIVVRQKMHAAEQLKRVASMSSVDVINKQDLMPRIEIPPAPGEVENFVAAREAAAESEEEIYDSIDKMKEVFQIAPEKTYKVRRWDIEQFKTPVMYNFTPGMDYPVAIPQESTGTPHVEWWGCDPEENELIILEPQDNAYRLTRLELKDFIIYQVPYYDGRVIKRIVSRSEQELTSISEDVYIQAKTLEVGSGILLVCIDHPDGTNYTFACGEEVFYKHVVQKTTA